MFHYKMRAEAMIDAARALLVLSIPGELADVVITGPTPFHGDVEISFHHKRSLAAIWVLLGKVVDGHVMVRTVDLEWAYDGEEKRDKFCLEEEACTNCGEMGGCNAIHNGLCKCCENGWDGLPGSVAEWAAARGEESDGTCTSCGDRADDGEGWDGMCGNCADRAFGRGE